VVQLFVLCLQVMVQHLLLLRLLQHLVMTQVLPPTVRCLLPSFHSIHWALCVTNIEKCPSNSACS
jgi:hypothetical protein